MANTSILAAFERMWQHVVAALANKSDTNHVHIASEVGADASGSAANALSSANAYTDAEITEWVGDTKVSTQISNAMANVQTELDGKANSSDLANYLPLSGGTLTGQLNVSGGDGSINLVSTNEGGNIQIYSPSSVGGYWEIDAYNGNLRAYRNNGGNVEQHNSFPATAGTLLNENSVGDAAFKSCQDSTSAGTLSSSRTGLCTERNIYYGLPTINGSHTYTSSTNIYAPTSVGTNGYVLVSNGSGAPSWKSLSSFTMKTATASFTTSNVLQYDCGTPELDDSASKLASASINFAKIAGTKMAYMYGSISIYNPGQDVRKIWRNSSSGFFPAGFEPAYLMRDSGYETNKSQFVGWDAYTDSISIILAPAHWSETYATLHFCAGGNIGDTTFYFCVPYYTTSTD